MVRAYLGLGGNLGDPVANMRQALQAIDGLDEVSVTAVSRLYRTPPWGKLDQPWFVNACAAVETTLGPRALLDLCLATERGLKRERLERWGPRTIDLDVLTYGDVKLQTKQLELPHPRMTGRGFVMMPLNDIAADMIVDGKPVGAWLAAADIAGIEIADDNRNWWTRCV